MLDLYKGGTITLDEAMAHADSRANLEAKINFGGHLCVGAILSSWYKWKLL